MVGGGNAELTDNQKKRIDETNLKKAISELGKKMKAHQHDRYHFAVTILMDGKKLTRNQNFLQLFIIVKDKFGSYPSAVSFTITVLERSEWGDIADLQKFALPKFDLHDHVDLCLTAHDYYSIMTDDEFHSAKFNIPGIDNIDSLDRFNFVLLLFNRRVINVCDVSKIEDKEVYPHYFDEYKKRCKSKFTCPTVCNS